MGILFVSLLGAAFGVASPLFQKVFVDRLMGTPSLEVQFPILPPIGPLTAVLLAFVCTLLAQVLVLVTNYLCVNEGTILQKIVSEELYKKTLSIRSDSMGKTTVGEVVSLYATDVPGASAFVDQVAPQAMNIFCNLLLAPLAIIAIGGMPLGPTFLVIGIVVTVTFLLAARQSRFFGRFKQLAAERTGLVNEWIQTIRLLRILGWVENFEAKIIDKRVEETHNRIRMVTNGQLMNAYGSSINFVINLVGVASLIYLSQRQPTPGELFALLWIFGIFLVRPFRQLPWFFTFTLDSTTSMKRLETFLARPSDAGGIDFEREEKTPEVQNSRSLSVRGLNLEIGGQKILSDIDFDIAEGEFVAVVGEVGAGKSMLTLSLVGETGADFKEFKIGNIDATKLSLEERRRFFGFVPQEGFVMSATLRENIVFEYDPEPNQDEKIITSLKAAQFSLDEEMQDAAGLSAEIGERGVNLSGGQRQRVSLARAHRFDRSILLLDDCLSAVDVDTERQLLDSLFDGKWKDRTRILVTHRLSVLDQVDRVFLMEHGQIVESGRFHELLARSKRMQAFVASVQRGEEGSPSAAKLLEDEVVVDKSVEGGPGVETESVS